MSEKQAGSPKYCVELGDDNGDHAYDIYPAITTEHVRKVFPEAVRRFIIEKIKPHGGGFHMVKEKVREEDNFESDETAVGLTIGRKTPKSDVETLFSMLRDIGINIHITTENYPEEPASRELIKKLVEK